MTRAGIAVAGNLLTDYVKRVNTYPRPGQLANILSLSRAVGGCVPNTLLDLARIDPEMPLFAYGCVGGEPVGRGRGQRDEKPGTIAENDEGMGETSV